MTEEETVIRRYILTRDDRRNSYQKIYILTRDDRRRNSSSEGIREKEIIMKNFRNFMKEEEGMGTVEIVLIIVVLVALVAIFKNSIKSLVEKILKKVTDNANKI